MNGMYNDFNDNLIKNIKYIDESVYIETTKFVYFDEPSSTDLISDLNYYTALNAASVKASST